MQVQTPGKMQSRSPGLQHVPSMSHIPEHDSAAAAAQQPTPELGVNGVVVQRLAETDPAAESQAKPKVSGGGWGMVRPALKRTKSDASKQPDPELGMKPEGSNGSAETTPLKRSLSNNGGWGALRRHSSSMEANEDSGGQLIASVHLLGHTGNQSFFCGCWEGRQGFKQAVFSIQGASWACKSQEQGVGADVGIAKHATRGLIHPAVFPAIA